MTSGIGQGSLWRLRQGNQMPARIYALGWNGSRVCSQPERCDLSILPTTILDNK